MLLRVVTSCMMPERARVAPGPIVGLRALSKRPHALAGWSTSQHDVPGQLHVSVVLGEFFVTLE